MEGKRKGRFLIGKKSKTHAYIEAKSLSWSEIFSGEYKIVLNGWWTYDYDMFDN